MLSFARVEKNYVLSFLVTEDGAATANEYCAISGGTENGSVNMTENGSVFLRSVNSATRASAITGGVMNKFMDTEKNALVRTYCIGYFDIASRDCRVDHSYISFSLPSSSLLFLPLFYIFTIRTNP